MADLHTDSPAPSPERRARILERGRARRRRKQVLQAGGVAAVMALAALAFTLQQHASESVHTGGHGSTLPPATTTSSPPAPTPTTTSTRVTVSPTTTGPTTSVPGVATGGTNGVQNLPIDRDTVAALRALFAEAKGYALDEVSPKEVAAFTFYAYAPQTQTYWAWVTFDGSSAMTYDHGVSMQDGGNQGIFARSTAGSWRMVAGGSLPYPCHVLPPDVEQVWHRTPTVAACGVTPDVPTGGPMHLVLGADEFLYPDGWTVTHLHAVGPRTEASAESPDGRSRIDLVVDPTLPDSVVREAPDANGDRAFAYKAVLQREQPCAGVSSNGFRGTDWIRFSCSTSLADLTVRWGTMRVGTLSPIHTNGVSWLVVTTKGTAFAYPSAIFEAFEFSYPAVQ